ncbi:glutamate--tRNA ligase [Candidatus Woesearchaeota archaeon]|nr:glutamate--tRNA ligase [Candidatus Woesearchaeota archaeon]
MTLAKLIRLFTLQNAALHNGVAQADSVLSRILGENPELKPKAKELMVKIAPVVIEINTLGADECVRILASEAPDLLEKKEGAKKDVLKPLPNVSGPVRMRAAPSPSGPLHIGHAFTIIPNAEYVKMYGGAFILRLEDTNQDNVMPEAYKMIEDDTRWLSQNNLNEVFIQSERMELYYQTALALLEEHHAYVCTCEGEAWKNLIEEGSPCPCRDKSAKSNIEDWHKMHTGEYPEGAAVVRLKTDVAHKNPAMRDFAILRINETEHPRQGNKYRVWPLMNFSVAADDYSMGLTHVLRGKDHFDNTRRQKYIFDYLGWKTPEYIHYGRIQFDGLRLSTTETKAAITAGTYDGWNDVRLPTIGALRRRGFQAEAFRRFVIGMGISLTDKHVDVKEFFKSLEYHNRQLIEADANRYFLVIDPKEVTVLDAPAVYAEFDLHPEHRKGGRKLSAEGTFLLQAEDLAALPTGQVYRLMEGLNFTSEAHAYRFHSSDVATYRKLGGRIMHWLPASPENLDVEVLMNDGTVQKGKGERHLASIKPGQIVQFERHYFARFEGKQGNVYIFVYTHK